MITLSALELVVTDLPSSLAFYRLLGLDLPPEADTEPHVETTLPGGFKVMWDPVETIKAVDPSWTPPQGGHRTALACDCGTPAGVDAAYAEITGAGYHGHSEPWDAFWGQRYAVVHDPDGNPVDFFAPLT